MTSHARPRGNTESWTPIQLAHVETAARRRHDARMHRLASVCVALVLSACSSAPPQRVISSRDVVAEGGAVVSVDVIASRVGAEILAKGGNAVDAAIATAFALAVTWPEAGNLGGGGFMLVRMADGEKAFIDYREIAPAAATPTMFLDADGNVDPVRVRLGYTPVGVPGTVAGLAEAHERFGSLDWAELIEPAYELARDGIPISDALASSIEAEQAELALDPEAHRIFLLEDGTHRRAGMRLVQSDLAESLRQIADEGSDAFYRGAIAERICADAQARGGLLTQDDFARYEARVREPLGASYRDHVILAGPPPTSGGFVLVSALRQLEGFDLKALGAGSGEELHLIGETLRRAFLDRALWFADPDFVPVPVSDLLAEDHIDALRASIEQNASTFSDELAGDLDGTLIVDESEQTTHFSVVDSAGNAVANTYTLEESWGREVRRRGHRHRDEQRAARLQSAARHQHDEGPRRHAAEHDRARQASVVVDVPGARVRSRRSLEARRRESRRPHDPLDGAARGHGRHRSRPLSARGDRPRARASPTVPGRTRRREATVAYRAREARITGPRDAFGESHRRRALHRLGSALEALRRERGRATRGLGGGSRAGRGVSEERVDHSMRNERSFKPPSGTTIVLVSNVFERPSKRTYRGSLPGGPGVRGVAFLTHHTDSS
jgi:gamma-glutamyltranspeptidase